MGRWSRIFRMSDDRKLRSESSNPPTGNSKKTGTIPKASGGTGAGKPPANNTKTLGGASSKNPAKNANKNSGEINMQNPTGTGQKGPGGNVYENPSGSSTSGTAHHSGVTSTEAPILPQGNVQTSTGVETRPLGTPTLDPTSNGDDSQDNDSQTSQSTIPSPNYSSLTALNIRQDFIRQREEQNLRLNDRVVPTVAINSSGLTLQDYIRVSVRASHSEILGEMRRMFQEFVREERESERGIRNSADANLENTVAPPPTTQSNLPPTNTFLPQAQPQLPHHNLNMRPTYSQVNSGNQNFTPAQSNMQMPDLRQLNLNDSPNMTHQHSNQHHPPLFENFANAPPPLNPYTQEGNGHQYYQPPFWNPHIYQPPYRDRNVTYGMDKWSIKYDGTTKNVSVEDFLFRVEAIRQDNGCPDEILTKGFHHLLSGEAYDWLWSYRQRYPGCQWDQLRQAMIKKFRRHESDYEIQCKIMERRQGYNENCETYINDVIKLRNQMRTPIPELDFVRIVKENLKDSVMQLVYPMKMVCIDQLTEECKRAEKNILKRRQDYNRLRAAPKVHELEYCDPQNNFLELHAIHTGDVPENKKNCWNCRLPGHTFYECKSTIRGFFCYRCGYDGVITTNCPRCSENRQRNMTTTGAACSSQQQQQQQQPQQ